ncbi:MAG: hypothetical protein IKX91_04615, partial [Firmicutes bacterium]|nr:hypothetical protein [Bacillota bacterium]
MIRKRYNKTWQTVSAILLLAAVLLCAGGCTKTVPDAPEPPKPMPTHSIPLFETDELDAAIERTAFYYGATYYIDAYRERYDAYRDLHPDLAAEAVIRAVNAETDRPFYTETTHADLSYGYLALVNK